MFTVTCSACGATMQVPVEPPQGVELTCVECLQQQEAEESTQVSNAR